MPSGSNGTAALHAPRSCTHRSYSIRVKRAMDARREGGRQKTRCLSIEESVDSDCLRNSETGQVGPKGLWRATFACPRNSDAKLGYYRTPSPSKFLILKDVMPMDINCLGYHKLFQLNYQSNHYKRVSTHYESLNDERQALSRPMASLLASICTNRASRILRCSNVKPS